MAATGGKPNLDVHMKAWKTFSYVISAALNVLGYSYDTVKTRQRLFETYYDGGTGRILVGSKAEGLTKWYENDFDAMFVMGTLFCVYDINEAKFNSVCIALLAEMEGVDPGYTKLKIVFPQDVKKAHCLSFLSEMCIETASKELYLSSVLFNSVNSKEVAKVHQHRNAGPALMVDIGDRSSMDCVLAIPYKCTRLMHEWRDRARTGGWPDPQVIKDVSQLDWHIVPVGASKNESIEEWRICFTLGEKHLIKALNDTQLQLLILLKFIADRILKPLCPALSSYTMKNLVLWMAEIIPLERFRPQNLSFLLILALATLKKAVGNRHLKNYMIPSRNLFLGKITAEEKQKLMEEFDGFLKNGPEFLLKDIRLSNLAEVMVMVCKRPELCKQTQKKIDAAERATIEYTLFRERKLFDQLMKHGAEIEVYNGQLTA